MALPVLDVLWRHKRFWLLPLVLATGIVAALWWSGQADPLAPFTYGP